MRALTLTQPWTGLVASGLKPIENRPRPIIKREDFGKPFALHASREIDEAVYDRIAQIAPELATRVSGFGDEINWAFDVTQPWFQLSRITSAVIGVATIESAVIEFTAADGAEYVVDLASKHVVDLGDQRRWFFGLIGYVLRDIRALATPVPCRGWQGFWTLPDDVVARVEEQLR